MQPATSRFGAEGNQTESLSFCLQSFGVPSMGSIAEFAFLSLRERAICYRRYAKEAERWAQRAHTMDARASCSFLAKQWNDLADRIEPDPPDPAQKDSSSGIR